MLGSPLSQLRHKPMGFPSNEAMAGADFLDKFPGMVRMNPRLDSRSFLDSRSSSPVDSETSGFSSSSDHLSDLLVGLWVYGSIFSLVWLISIACDYIKNDACNAFPDFPGGSLGVCLSDVCMFYKDTTWSSFVFSFGSHPWGSLLRWTLWCPICKKIIWSWLWVKGWTTTTLLSPLLPVPRQLMLWPNAGPGHQCGLTWTSWMLQMRHLVLNGRPGSIDKLLVCMWSFYFYPSKWLTFVDLYCRCNLFDLAPSHVDLHSTFSTSVLLIGLDASKVFHLLCSFVFTQLWMRPLLPGADNCHLETTRIQCIPAKSFWEVYHGILLRVCSHCFHASWFRLLPATVCFHPLWKGVNEQSLNKSKNIQCLQ